jgi:hypothetical protein
MASNMNMMQMFQFVRNSGNPEQFTLNMLEQRSNNPMMANLLNLVKKGDTKGIEQVARNACKEQGKDFDKEFASFKQLIGL